MWHLGHVTKMATKPIVKPLQKSIQKATYNMKNDRSLTAVYYRSFIEPCHENICFVLGNNKGAQFALNIFVCNQDHIYFLVTVILNLSLVVRKPVFGVVGQV